MVTPKGSISRFLLPIMVYFLSLEVLKNNEPHGLKCHACMSICEHAANVLHKHESALECAWRERIFSCGEFEKQQFSEAEYLRRLCVFFPCVACGLRMENNIRDPSQNEDQNELRKKHKKHHPLYTRRAAEGRAHHQAKHQ